jgi:hypothetical protein
MSCSALIRSAPWICTRWLRERLAETLAPVGPQGPPARRCARLVAVAPRARGSLLWTTGTSCVSANLSTMSPNTCPPSLQPLQAGGEGKGRVVRATLWRQIFEQPVVTLSPDSLALAGRGSG